ncbi:MAG: hypothetical protein A2Y40_02660 [Candidatus Margulisbacteria bacterium GWF2_35_9]|nr:MAG: hypothetical protein A2Y40_02660 [Candidatus Margulisbacteria bacterium GWF2_35_9]
MRKIKIDFKQYLTKQNLVIVGIVFVVIVFVYLVYGGLFSRAKVIEGTSPQYILIYQSLKGSYLKGASNSNKTYKWLKSHDIAVDNKFEYYFDNPMEEEKEDLRYIAGCTVKNKDYERLDFIMNKFSVEIFFPVRAVYIIFPARNQFSKIAGLRVYWKLFRYANKKQYPKNAIIVVTDIEKKQTTYLMPIDPDYNAVGRYY